MKTILLSTFVLMFSTFSFAQVTINEVDANTPGTDMMEFVELYSESSISLDGHVLVLFNGSDDASYNVIDLSGNMISDGYFVIGNAATPNVDLVIDDNSLQNGADAVALYQGAAEDFPNDTPVTTMGLVDAVVYGTNDDNDLGLFALLDAGCQIQVDEDANGDDDNQSSARIPDGGTALCPNDFIQQAPTPGETNVPSCFGGTIAFDDETTETEVCIDDDAIEILMYAASGNSGDGSIYVITDEDDIIINSTTDMVFDTNTAPEGVCRIYHVSYNGVLDTETTAAGEDLSAIASDGDCVSVSTNYVNIIRNVCNPPCDGAMVSSDAGNEVVVCLDEEADVIEFSNTGISAEDTYVYVVTDENNLVITTLAGNSNDFNAAEAGVCRVWGLSYQGVLDETTIEAGDPLLGISSDGVCLEVSENYINITRQECLEVEGCGSIFFSEYQEGSGNNKALEIYNPTQLPVSLSDYQLVNCSNGCDIPDSWDFQNDIFEDAVIQPGDVFVVAHGDADQTILDQADVLFPFLSNGNDVFALQRISTSEIIDIIGENGDDPGSGFMVNGVENGTQNHTLVRMPGFNEGNPDWSTANLEWEVLDQDVFENLGSHTIIPCSANTDTSVSFATGSMSVDEEAGTATVSVNILNPLDEDMTVMVEISGGTAVSPDDFDGSGFPIMLTFPAGMEDAQTFDVTIVDDAMEEAAETIEFMLTTPSEGVELGVSDFTLTINESDVVVEVTPIAEAAALDADGVAVNLGVEMELRGVVYGVNMRPSGLQFTLIDPTDGIGVFNFEGDLGYTVNEGDSIHVVGTIGQFNGLTQINPTSVMFATADNELIEPTVVTELNEFSESNLVRIECVSLVDASQWVNDGSGFNVDLTDGTNTYLMRVDADTDVYGTAAPEGPFTLTGIGGQFDSSAPFDEGYQILPRYIEDLAEAVNADFTAAFEIDGVDISSDIEGGFVEVLTGGLIEDEWYNLTFTGANDAWNYVWTINGVEYTDAEFTIPGAEVLAWGTSVVSATVTVINGECSITEDFSFDITFNGVEEIEANIIELFPNPATLNLTIDSPVTGVITIYNQMGQAVKELEIESPGQQTVSVTELTTGVYFLELTSENTVYRTQFIKK